MPPKRTGTPKVGTKLPPKTPAAAADGDVKGPATTTKATLAKTKTTARKPSARTVNKKPTATKVAGQSRPTIAGAILGDNEVIQDPDHVEAETYVDKGEDLNVAEIVPPELPEEVPGKPSPWMDVPELSDEIMQVQATNILSHQRNMMILRFVVNGQALPQIHVVERMHYNGNAAPKPFIAR